MNVERWGVGAAYTGLMPYHGGGWELGGGCDYKMAAIFFTFDKV